MNQEKIGKFIAKCRKEKKITQSELAEKLNVTDRSISNWETGRNMPDLSLFKPLCDELDITINDLMSGEKIKPEDYNEKLNENIINTINYSHKKISYTIKSMGIFLITIGILISITAFSIFPSESSWGSIYGIVGGIISFLGITKFTNKYSLLKKLILNISYLLFYILILFIIDFIAVLNIKQPPRFALLKESSEKMIVYRAPFYNVYRINYNSLNEYYIIDTKHKYTDETIPVSPFNREKAGINNIIKYKNKYLGNNSNTGNLINNIPLS